MRLLLDLGQALVAYGMQNSMMSNDPGITGIISII
jgi:hypothetical protein